MSKNKSIWVSVAGALTSIFAFLGIVSCCGMPIIAGILSLLGIGASQLSFFAEYRWWFIAISVICLVWGFLQLYGKKKPCCCSCCTEQSGGDTTPSKQILAKLFLWFGTILTGIIIVCNLMFAGASAGTCCSAQSAQPVQPGCCGASDDMVETESEGCSSASSCCSSEEALETPNACCNKMQ